MRRFAKRESLIHSLRSANMNDVLNTNSEGGTSIPQPQARAVEPFTLQERIAYFTMEIALRSSIPTYAGGLGVLAGDMIRSAADCELPLVTVSLVSRMGYFRQEINSLGCQVEHPDPWDPSVHASRLHAQVAVSIEGRDVWVGAWLFVVEGVTHAEQPVILLDTNLEQNGSVDRQITDSLYGGDATYRLKQEIVLGIGGVRMLAALGFRVRQFHLNDGHSALLTLELLRQYAYTPEIVRAGEAKYNLQKVRERCNFTTHTPVEAGHDRFDYELSQGVLGNFIDTSVMKSLAGASTLNMTQLAMNLSEYVNGVARRHAETSQQMFPGHRVRAVTNGVHAATWASPFMRRLFDAHFPGWRHEPEMLVRVDCCIPNHAIWQAHQEAKQSLIALVRNSVGTELDLDIPILGFARRMTAYKRAGLLFSDLAKLRTIARKKPFQIVLSGKAHPKDLEGKRLIEMIHQHRRDLEGSLTVVFLPNYNLDIAAALVAGCDVWINTPVPPLEASGTSGMKAALNGVPNFSVLDGWWAEGCIEGVTGWAIGDGQTQASGGDAMSFYDKLERMVLPLYYDDRAAWIHVMKGAISKNGSIFTSHRMIRRYAADAYMR